MAKYKPANTKPIDIHCVTLNECPNVQTESKIVKNLRVVVIVVTITGEYLVKFGEISEIGYGQYDRRLTKRGSKR